MKPKNIALGLSVLALIACGNAGTEESAENIYIDVTPDISVAATSAFYTDTIIKDVTFVPNDVASWLGKAILLDRDGALYRTSIASPKTELIAKGPYTDIVGFDRPGEAGVFLATKPDNTLHLFIEADDEGSFKRVDVIHKPNWRSFCQTSPAENMLFQAIAQKKGPEQYRLSQNADGEFYISRDSDASTTECTPNISRLESDKKIHLTVNPTGPHLLLTHNDVSKVIEVKNGLSIAGITNPGLVAATHTPMGGAFSDGVVLVADSNAPRVVIIARDYLTEVVTTP